MSLQTVVIPSVLTMILKGEINLSTDTLKCILVSPALAFDRDTMTKYVDVQAHELLTGNGYTNGGQTLTSVNVATDAILKQSVMTCAIIAWAAVGGNIGPTIAAIIFDDSHTDKPIIAYVSFGMQLTKADGETLSIYDFKVILADGYVDDSLVIVNSTAVDGIGMLVRQTVQGGSVDANNLPNFMSAGTGLSVNVAATATPLRISFANGFNDQGPVEYTGKISADMVIPGLPPNRRSFIYADRNPATGQITFGNTGLIPTYGRQPEDAGHSLLHMEGANGGAANVDEHGWTWGVSGGAALSNVVTPPFGTTSLRLVGASSQNLYANTHSGYTTHAGFGKGYFTAEFWFRADNIATTQALFSANISGQPYGVAIYLTNSKLMAYLSDNASSWNRVNGVAGASTLLSATWYKLIIEKGPNGFRVWCGIAGSTLTKEIEVAGTGWGGCDTVILTFGSHNASSFLTGNIKEIRLSNCTVGNQRYGDGAIAPETAPFAVYQDQHWFDIAKMKMYVKNPAGSWVEVQRVFLGEVSTDATSVIGVTNYAYNGYYESEWFPAAVNTTYQKNDNLGYEKVERIALTRCYRDYRYHTPHFNLYAAFNGSVNLNFGAFWHSCMRNTSAISTASTNVAVEGCVWFVAADYKIVCKRGW